jgi:translation initiation factor IF-3
MNDTHRQDADKNRNDKREKFVRHNWKIKAQQCRLVEEGKPPRVMPTKNALEYAQGLGLDLVEVNYDYKSGISTCKVCDYGKFMYDMKRREKDAKKQARAAAVDVKCIQISLTTDTADLDRIVRHGREFLDSGDKVRLALRLRGRREMANVKAAEQVIAGVMERFKDVAVVEQPVSLSGRELSCVFRKSQTQKQVKAQEQPRPAGGITITVG